MQYRTFGQLEWAPSALGFGTMRLPVKAEKDRWSIDEVQARRIVRYAIDHGVNYIDTAYSYHDGMSERFVGRCLSGGYRELVKIATKSPVWLLEKPGDFGRYLDEQLERLRVNSVDFYLLHGLFQERWEKAKQVRIFRDAERALSDGKIGYLGFSFHGGVNLFKEIVDYYPWTFCQVQYNYMDIQYQAGTDGVKHAAHKGLAVIVMEPMRGGALAVDSPVVRDLWEKAPVKRSPAEWALQWLWSQPEVSLVLSGMRTIEEVRDNVGAANRSGIGTLSLEELAVISAVRERYKSLDWIPCTSCRYCMPCPHGVNIPLCFDAVNRAAVFSELSRYRREYAQWSSTARADACVGCGKCEQHCPQHLPIRALLTRVHKTLGAELEECPPSCRGLASSAEG